MHFNFGYNYLWKDNALHYEYLYNTKYIKILNVTDFFKCDELHINTKL